jgi:hypothetical protein
MKFISFLISIYLCFFNLCAENIPNFLEKKSYEALKESSYPLVTIAFHYNKKRLCYLEKVLKSLSTFPKIEVVIITNTCSSRKLLEIEECHVKAFANKTKHQKVSTRSFYLLDHPFDLTWCHKEMIPEEFIDNTKGYTHFIYLEDDIALDFNNFCYFVHFRKVLKDKGVLPSFLRVEVNKKGEFVNTDNEVSMNVANIPHIHYKKLLFVNTVNPYMACYILDMDLAKEYILTPAFDKNLSLANDSRIRELSAMGLMQENVPTSYSSRYVVPVDLKSLNCPKYAWIYHLPNNYADDPLTRYGKISMESLFYLSDQS